MSHTITIEINNRPLTIEVGKMGRQADGSALVRQGDTIMFVTATSKREAKEDRPFLPLIVDYRENTYAAGKIPGGFFKREGRPSEREILISRLIDRPIRPLFPQGYNFDTQIVALLLSADLENEYDTLGVIGASAALYFSDIPFTTPLGAAKIGYGPEGFIINPTASELGKSLMNMVVIGNEQGVIMVEAGGKEIEEAKVKEALALALDPIRTIIQAQKDAYQKLNVRKRPFTPKTIDPAKVQAIKSAVSERLFQAIQVKNKKASEAEVKKILDSQLETVPADKPTEVFETKESFYQIQKKMVRDFILDKGRRVDGRALDEIRPISIEVGLLPRTHGSALFTRGETQCLATVTLGTFEDVQRLDSLGEESEKRFMLHYNFPAFSVGEVSFLRAPGRREIGHGALAEKSILPSIPPEDVFPYTVRIVSDILESNGSSSMASVCGGVLSLMDAGVPLSMTVAGIAMGLVKEGDRYRILTDIAGLEDHFGDMDFKIAGTEKGVTAVQLDLKIPGVGLDVLNEAIDQARLARLQVLAKMKEAIAAPRPEISPYAPHIIFLFVNPEKVGDVIGPAGKVIKRIVALTKAKIDIDETGKVVIASTDKEAAEKARTMIQEITAEAEIGRTYEGKIVRLEEYGAFVEILPNLVGLMHVSEVAHARTPNIRDVLQMGQVVKVKVLGVEEGNKIKLSMKALVPPPEGGSGEGSSDGQGRDSGPKPYDKRRRPSDRPPRRDRF
ncbi:MAG: polyribonucleotide nucleotidyltransferase [Candidatus Aminicenantes bacterium]|nr:polyribonucleotide nucleotidyltransferase [Candidatus Aminicenantes bacterium]